ncbi:twin-arginine translocation signal domain-containing protein [Micromonospora endophytica]|nr:twin-arginine translocation signal domain-containing protein [Micromonospora endophytica]
MDSSLSRRRLLGAVTVTGMAMATAIVPAGTAQAAPTRPDLTAHA